MATKFKQLSNAFIVSSQLHIEDINAVVAYPVKAVICHRPDEELSDWHTNNKPSHSMIEDVLTQHDIAFIYQPIHHNISIPEALKLDQYMEVLPRPVLAYCTSGMRSTLLWALGQTLKNKQPRARIIAAAETAGYQIGQYLPIQKD